MNNVDRPIVYFAGAIRGDRSLAETMIRLVAFIKGLGFPVLTEHVGAEDPIAAFAEKIGKRKEDLTAEDIEHQDIAWLDQATHVIAEISGASTGTGREIEYARTKGMLGKTPAKILLIYRKDKEFGASPMVRGMTGERYPMVTVRAYTSVEDVEAFIETFLHER